MKPFFLLTACASLAFAHAADCDLTSVLPLLKDPNVVKCSADTGFSPPTPPSVDMLPLICASTSCQSALMTIKALDLGDCTIGSVKLETDLIHPIEAFCAVASASTPTATNKTTLSPSAAAISTGGSSSSTTEDNSASDVVVPAKTTLTLTPSPSPTPASSAPSVVTAASTPVAFVFVFAIAALLA